jgi:hypothetical protein
MTKFSAVHDGERTGDSRVMTSAPRICRKCGAEILADAPEGLCTACLFETGLDLLAHESVVPQERDDPGRDDRVPLPDKTNSSKRSKAFADFGDYPPPVWIIPVSFQFTKSASAMAPAISA